jgi:hypothetical protein
MGEPPSLHIGQTIAFELAIHIFDRALSFRFCFQIILDKEILQILFRLYKKNFEGFKHPGGGLRGRINFDSRLRSRRL